MDENTIRERAQAHGQATVAGDLKTAGRDLDKSAYEAAGEVMKKLPEDLTGCEVTSIQDTGDRASVTIRYTGSGKSTEVESTWAEREGEAKIVDLKVL